MYDLKLNEKMDISLENDRVARPIKVKAFLSESGFPAQRISFVTGIDPMTRVRPTGQRVSFSFGDTKNIATAKTKSVEGLEEAIQAIVLQFRAELYGAYSEEVGSNLYKYRHTMYFDEKSLSKIEDMAQEIVDGILEDAVVSVEEVVDERAGYFSCQAIRITVFYDEEILTEYII